MNTFKLPNSLMMRPIKIALVGAGGTGSALLTELFQMDYLLRNISQHSVYLDIAVFDDDEVSHSNVGRQSFWACDIGNNKAETLVNRFNVHGGLSWTAHRERVSKAHVDQLAKFDVLITCDDKAAVRAELGSAFNQVKRFAETLWLDMGNDKNSGQVVLGHAFDRENKLPNVFDLYPSLSEMVDKDEDSCSHEAALQKQEFGINKKVALEASTLLWKLLRHGEIKHHGAFINMNETSVHPLKIDTQTWAMFGYQS